MRLRNLFLLPLLALLAAGCVRNRDASGTKSSQDSTRNRPAVSFSSRSLKDTLRFEDGGYHSENGFLVAQLKVRNSGPRDLPCEWRTTFQDKDGMELPVDANPWTPLLLNRLETQSLSRTASMPGASSAVFHLREAASPQK